MYNATKLKLAYAKIKTSELSSINQEALLEGHRLDIKNQQEKNVQTHTEKPAVSHSEKGKIKILCMLIYTYSHLNQELKVAINCV